MNTDNSNHIQSIIITALNKFPKLSQARLSRIVAKNTPDSVDIKAALNELMQSQAIYQDASGKYALMTDAQRNALNTKRKSNYHSDEHEKILRRTRAKMLRLLNHGRPIRDKKFAALLGCESMAAFRDYLESLFQPGMTWENHGVGKGKWNIDHITPCASYDLTDPKQFSQCWNHKNMRPLWAEDNLRLQIEAKKKRRKSTT